MILIIIAILFLDQASKFLITQKLYLGQSLPLLKGFFHLTLVHNRGAAFGLFRDQVIFLILLSFFAIASIIHNLRRQRPGEKLNLEKLALSLVLAGALGNLIDRLYFGYVIDFLDLRIWPVFNLADSAISIGAVLLAYALFKEPKVKGQ